MLDEIPEDFGSPLWVSRSRFVQIEPGFIRGLERALRFVSNRTLQTFLSSTGSYDGAVPREAVVRALDALNHVYWNDTSLRQVQKDLLRTLHQDLQNQLDGGSSGHSRLPRSPKTPSKRKPQLTLEEIKKRQQQRKRSMSTLKDQLIRLGSEHPNLQSHLRPVLDKLSYADGDYGDQSENRAFYPEGSPQAKSAFSRTSSWRKWEAVVRALRPEKALLNLIQYIGERKTRENFEFIATMHDLPIEVRSNSRGAVLLDEFESYMGIHTLSDEFVKAMSKRLLEEAVDDIMHMYGI